MKFERTELAGIVIVSADEYVDCRGTFARTFDAAEFAAVGLPAAWPQCSTSTNLRRGTLRGMHFQALLHSDPKLVRCTRGRVYDVALDLRPQSGTFCRWFGMELSHESRSALFIPAGCAHGFITLEDNCEVFYMIGENYVPTLARGVRWNDPAFRIVWPIEPVTMSARDASYPDFLSSSATLLQDL
jgi:dTDP-4-dehydrorhamnose 3,5-epimerase